MLNIFVFSYDIILSCWRCNPEKRPKFNDLETALSNILEKIESKHYIDLNEPYEMANEFRFNSSGETDYLALLQSPDSQAPSVPVNALREELFSTKQNDDKLTATNDLYMKTNTLGLSKNIPNTSEESVSLRIFKSNDLS